MSLKKICQGLEYLHPTIVHRDLKDFGLARIRSMTLPTLSPEAGTDMYSLGVLLWVMLTGQQPWECWETDPYRRPAAAEAYKELLLLQQREPAAGGSAQDEHRSGGGAAELSSRSDGATQP
ncbi:hypothetical protein GPECTOR_15g305 [Gonium pectorale]|uniref:Protein kinase domain-containing protein n=1 Tax=Gonium pectorale TaxID=33097 RepID=A0A150GLD5_GONPE|nr:hypothetical protein GPECTOR_15g305 [Gonium pectorale]|eukprot:KXZ50622.1 hypothetical protein GPECTOR_15g305 [Gonium pectorale]